jgi:HEAT repeat protein
VHPTPLLDFFRRGEVERDVRLQAAQGALAPRAHEQLAILVLLLEDQDREIRETADETLNRIPVEALQTFLALSDVPIDLREFFVDRGIFPA